MNMFSLGASGYAGMRPEGDLIEQDAKGVAREAWRKVLQY